MDLTSSTCCKFVQDRMRSSLSASKAERLLPDNSGKLQSSAFTAMDIVCCCIPSVHAGKEILEMHLVLACR